MISPSFSIKVSPDCRAAVQRQVLVAQIAND
jgi:hypothetical protein